MLSRFVSILDATSSFSLPPVLTRTFRVLTVLGVLSGGLLASTGCTPVAPYERGKLAHPTMSAADMAGFGESHLRAITEGAVGGSGGTGSGCGCN